MPIYHVKTPTGEKLIEANTKAQAINYVTRSTITADVVSAPQVVDLMGKGIKVEKTDAQVPMTAEGSGQKEPEAGAVTAAKITTN